MGFAIPNISAIRAGTATPAQLGEALSAFAAAFDQVQVQANVNPQGAPPTANKIAALSVTARSGSVDLAIQDNSPATRGLEYFIEHSTTPNFSQPRVIHVGAARNHTLFLGNQQGAPLYFRAYSQYSGGAPSEPVYFGSATSPTPVLPGGAIAGPILQPSAGSGTAPSTGTVGGAGYGIVQVRG